MENKIKAEIISHSKRKDTGEEIITYKLTFPRIILSEVNTYKMMEKNTSSCLLGNTKISFYKEGLGFFFETIEDVYEMFNENKEDFKDIKIVSLNEDTEDYILQRVSNVFYSGKKPVYEIKFENGYSITCTKEHKLNTTDGWKTLEDYGVNDKTKCDLLKKEILSMELLSFADKYLGKEYSLYATKRFTYEKLFTPRISSIYYRGVKDVFDIEVDGKYHNFVANGFVVHNSRAIPFEKMVEVVEKEPFLPIAWQLSHRGMQGTEYLTDPKLIEYKNNAWLTARNEAVFFAKTVVGGIRDKDKQQTSEERFDFSDKVIPNTELSKNYGNRIIEPWTWVCQLITGTRESFEHLFDQRCPIYELEVCPDSVVYARSKKEFIEHYDCFKEKDDLWWLQHNKGQAEIHFMDLAEKMYDALNESKPIIMEENDWHIPFSDRPEFTPEMSLKDKIMLSCAMTARVSYTTIEDNETLTLEKARKIYEKCVEQWHFSVVSHVAKCMTNKEYRSWYKGFIEMKEYVDDFNETKRFFEANDFLNAQGYNKNLKGFISLRQYVEDEVNLNDI